MEAAAHLRLTNRGVAKIARRHGLCMVAGRNLLFTEGDVERIKDVMRVPAVPQVHPSLSSLSDYRLSESLRKLTRSKSASRKVRKLELERSKGK